MTRVFRVEHPSGVGPYRTGRLYSTDPAQWREIEDVSEQIGWAHSDREHPTPDADGIHGWTSEHVCGFASLGQAAEWFDGFGRELARVGFELIEFEVEDADVLVGLRQVVFRRDAATRVHTHDLASLDCVETPDSAAMRVA